MSDHAPSTGAAPFPLEGGRAGDWGEGATLKEERGRRLASQLTPPRGAHPHPTLPLRGGGLEEGKTSDLTASTHETIKAGSKSFALASVLFGRREREAAWRLYAWCRHCDDVVDGQVLGHGMSVDTTGAQARLNTLRRLTDQALDTDAPVPSEFQALREVARAHGVTKAQAHALLDGFAMDVEAHAYRTVDDTLLYAFHVAGIVGIMMAEVMGAREPETLKRACDLGLAFQLTNIARDVVEDARNGRVYLPADWLEEVGVEPTPQAVADPTNRQPVWAVAYRLLEEADGYYDSAREGICDLPLRSAWAIASARDVYRAIGRVVQARGARAWDARAGTSSTTKLLLLGRGGLTALASRFGKGGRERPYDLWTPPEAFTAAGAGGLRSAPTR